MKAELNKVCGNRPFKLLKLRSLTNDGKIFFVRDYTTTKPK